jgi:N-acetylmuramoyl-L-alanine amidase
METIAEHFGFHDYHTIYDDPLNSTLKVVRPNPHILYPGDKVVIPDKDPGNEPADTDKKHKFVVKSPKVTLILYLRRNDKPLAKQKYTLKVGKMSITDQTDDKGLIRQQVPLGEPLGLLTLPGPPSYTRKLNLGFLHPITKPSGIQMRLNNLGYGCGAPSGADSYSYTSALQAFQRQHVPNVTGKPDPDTINALRSEYEQGIAS